MFQQKKNCMKCIIEHLEPKMHEWCLIEYKRASDLVGKENFILTNVPKEDHEKVNNFAIVYEQSIENLDFKNKKLCILDPNAENILQPKEDFEYYVFGGILGDDPPSPRTKDELKVEGERRHLGKDQFPTDNAVLTTKLIHDGTPYDKIPFKLHMEIKIQEGEEVILPFKYVLQNGKPFISEKVIAIVKRDEGF